MTKKSQSKSNHHPVRRKPIPAAWMLLGGLALGAIAVLILVWISLTLNRGDGGPPQLQVSTDLLDLGKQTLGKTVHASFEVSNKGTGALTLTVPQLATVLEGC